MASCWRAVVDLRLLPDFVYFFSRTSNIFIQNDTKTLLPVITSFGDYPQAPATCSFASSLTCRNYIIVIILAKTIILWRVSDTGGFKGGFSPFGCALKKCTDEPTNVDISRFFALFLIADIPKSAPLSRVISYLITRN